MATRYVREAIVGTLVILAVTIFVLGTMWLSGRTLREHEVVRVQFSDVQGLKRASPVNISGVKVGRVDQIQLVDVGKVIVSLSIPPRIQPRTDASAVITAIGVVGDYVVDFNPGKAQPLPPGQVILGRTRTGITERAAQLGDRADSVLMGLQEVANEETARDLRGTLRSLQRTLNTSERAIRNLGDAEKGPAAELGRTMVALRKLSERLDSTLANPALNRALSRSDTLTSNLAAMTGQLANVSAHLDSLLAATNRGRGTIGKLATDSGLYQDLRDLSAEMRGLVAELQKNPGKLGVTVKIF
jgi:phospholipid/cholesterol/gamma-HCH transport system substrate-binding protein